MVNLIILVKREFDNDDDNDIKSNQFIISTNVHENGDN